MGHMGCEKREKRARDDSRRRDKTARTTTRCVRASGANETEDGVQLLLLSACLPAAANGLLLRWLRHASRGAELSRKPRSEHW